DLDAAVGEPEAVERRAHLHRYRASVERSRPQRVARLPRRGEQVRFAAAGEADRYGLAIAGNVEHDLAVAQADHALALAHHGLACALAGDAALALAEHVVDRRGHGGHDLRGVAFRHERAEALRVFLGDESGRKRALAPTLVLHQRGEERDVVADALDGE